MKHLFILACIFAGLAGFTYGFGLLLGKPCEHMIWSHAVVTITEVDGKVLSESPIDIRTCQP